MCRTCKKAFDCVSGLTDYQIINHDAVISNHKVSRLLTECDSDKAGYLFVFGKFCLLNGSSLRTNQSRDVMSASEDFEVRASSASLQHGPALDIGRRFDNCCVPWSVLHY